MLSQCPSDVYSQIGEEYRISRMQNKVNKSAIILFHLPTFSFYSLSDSLLLLHTFLAASHLCSTTAHNHVHTHRFRI